ncbi:MAG TPA: YggT family protein [Caulobacteraceae bacterium]|nr:YggT family protein [Caulobacteraceae bacterium]
MTSIVGFIFFIINALLELMVWAIIINAIMSWLVAFDVINYRNRFVYNVARFLDAVTRPILAPFQRFIPTLGGVDISPIIAILVIQGVRIYILPAIYNAITGAPAGI